MRFTSTRIRARAESRCAQSTDKFSRRLISNSWGIILSLSSPIICTALSFSAKKGKAEVEAFLTSLAVEHHVAAATQNLALSAILFLYREVLAAPLPWLDDVTRAKTMIYTHVLNRGGRGVRSPLDQL